MDKYETKIRKYELILDFNAPILRAPHRLCVNLKAGDEIICIEGRVYVKIPK